MRRRRVLAARVATAVGIGGLLAGAATTSARSIAGLPGVAGDTWAMITAFTDFGAVAYLVALAALVSATLLSFGAGRLVALLVALALTAVHLSWIVPGFVPDSDEVASTGRLTVYTQNLLFGEADPAEVVQAAADADVVVLVEVTTSAATRLADAGLGSRFRYYSGGPLPRTGAGGTRIYSRFPIARADRLNPGHGYHNWVVELAVPALGRVSVVGVHPSRPVRGGSRWADEQERVRTAVPRHRTVVAGDFNAVGSHPSLRRFRADGFRSASAVRGAGWQPTFPAQGRVPPLIAIDHILLSPDLTATDFGTVSVPGTDHRGVRAVVAVRS